MGVRVFKEKTFADGIYTQVLVGYRFLSQRWRQAGTAAASHCSTRTPLTSRLRLYASLA